MKYPVQIRDLQGAKRLVLPLFSMQPRSFGPLEAVIDTGAPKTIISASDAQKLRIPFNNLESTSPIIGFGKASTPALFMKSFVIAMKSDDGKINRKDISVIVTDVPTLNKFGQSILEHAFMMPTLIGMDFLEKNGLKLFVDVKGNIAYLED
jgi:predicted aspartyl protease